MVNSGEPSVVFCHCAVSGDLGPLRVSLESFAPHAARKIRPSPAWGRAAEWRTTAGNSAGCVPRFGPSPLSPKRPTPTPTLFEVALELVSCTAGI